MSPDSPDSPRPLGEISQGPSAFEQFLDRNQKNLVILSISIAVATAAYLVYHGVATSKEHTAGAELFKAKDLPALQNVVEKFRGTAAAGTATLPLAERQWTDGQQDAAIATLKAFIAANADHPARPSAQASLASKLKAQGKAAEAKQLFQELADDPAAAYLAPYALVSLGDIAKASGETEPAEKFYQKAKTNFPASSFTTTVDQRIALLKAKLPTEIEPPPAPAPAPGTPPAVPGASPLLPTVPPIAPGGVQPAIPGLPPSGQDTTESDVPPVNNPFVTDSKKAPAEAPAAETPAKPVTEPAAPEAPPAKPEAPPAPPAPPVQEPAAAPRSDSGTPAPPAVPAPSSNS